MAERQTAFAYPGDEFKEAYYKYIRTNIPLFAVDDELLTLMENNKINYFKIPAARTLCGFDIAFVFEIKEVDKVFVYCFKEVQRYESARTADSVAD